MPRNGAATRSKSRQLSAIYISAQGSYGAGVEPVDFEEPYRAAWVRIVRQLTIANVLQYAVVAAFLVSFAVPVIKGPLRSISIVVILVSLAARIVIRCPRCRALWPSGSDAEGQRKPCSRCALRWGQEDNLPDADSP